MQAGDWEAFSGEAKVGILGVKSYWGDCMDFPIDQGSKTFCYLSDKAFDFS